MTTPRSTCKDINPTPLTPWAARQLTRGQEIDYYDPRQDAWERVRWHGHAGANSALIKRDGSAYASCVCYAWLRA